MGRGVEIRILRSGLNISLNKILKIEVLNNWSQVFDFGELKSELHGNFARVVRF